MKRAVILKIITIITISSITLGVIGFRLAPAGIECRYMSFYAKAEFSGGNYSKSAVIAVFNSSPSIEMTEMSEDNYSILIHNTSVPDSDVIRMVSKVSFSKNAVSLSMHYRSSPSMNRIVYSVPDYDRWEADAKMQATKDRTTIQTYVNALEELLNSSLGMSIDNQRIHGGPWLPETTGWGFACFFSLILGVIFIIAIMPTERRKGPRSDKGDGDASTKHNQPDSTTPKKSATYEPVSDFPGFHRVQ